MYDVRFEFDGRKFAAPGGRSIAAALTQAGVRVFRRTASGAERGVFCGMGVCQDCLVIVDGAPNRRACMTPVADGMRVETQTAVPALGAGGRAPGVSARMIAPDVLVVGGGAGGLSAAIAARDAGASVVVVDERKVAGGQYYKQSADGAALDSQQREGADLVETARRSGAQILCGVEIWGAFDPLLFLAEQEGGALVARPRAAIIATGAYERPRMVPGWTLPGVMTTGAAQTLWRSYRTLPGKRVVLCGSGPLNLQVALELAKGGADVALVAERARAPYTRPLSGFALAAAGPDLAAKGAAMIAHLAARGVRIGWRTELVQVDPNGECLVATFRDAAGRETRIEADAVCMNEGFEPQNEILRLLGADMRYDASAGHLRCVRDETLRTSVENLYAVGDCAGLGGAPAAREEGRIAGAAAAARALGRPETPPSTEAARRLAAHRRFQARLWRLYDIAPRTLTDTPGHTTLCRCEEVSLARVRDDLAKGLGHAGVLKRAARVGMGRCQGRYCAPVAARLVAAATGRSLEDASYFAPRPPIKPVSIAIIAAAQDAVDAGERAGSL